MRSAKSKGLHEVGADVWVYLPPIAGWGYSNAGLIAGDRDSLLVDTLFDLRLTREMLDAMDSITSTRPIRRLVNTHSDGDHCFGNELVPDGATIYAAAGAAEEMHHATPSMVAALKSASDEEVREFAQHAFGDFDIDAVAGRLPDVTFEHQIELTVGGRDVIVHDLGPAHTVSDSIVMIPSARTVFAGDLVVAGGTPVAWSGPISNWTWACETIASLDVDAVVPGHGQITDTQGVLAVKAYFDYIFAETAKRHAAGVDSIEAAFDIELGEFAALAEPERLVVTVDTIYRDLDPDRSRPEIDVMWREMARYRRHRRSR